MAEIKRLTADEFRDIAAGRHFNEMTLTKDYYLTLILYLIKDVVGIYFKGGTALQKIFLNYSRLSEDIDMAVTRDINDVVKEIKDILEKNRFKVTKDKEVEGFTRLVIHYKGFSDEESTVFIDLNKRAKIMTKPEQHNVSHFYKNSIPDFYCSTLSREEVIAEKVAAAIARNQPRDHYDIYRVIKQDIPINVELVKKKCRDANVEFSIVKMFNNARILKNRWDRDLNPLLAEEVSFKWVMRTLADHFKLKGEKEKMKSNSNKLINSLF